MMMRVHVCVSAHVCVHCQVFGIKYGLRGFYDRASKPVTLTREMVDGIQLKGGTVLVGGWLL
jgi:6-phosphofructokinase